ncbi:delta-12 fatty acid desaturase protein [Amylostereum chailletii]|nr:delta-12 fatty acid desaturase protein [Amylostereum chailletii]
MSPPIFSDGHEYITRTQMPFVPPDIDMQALREAIPKHAFHRSTKRALIGISPIVTSSALLFACAFYIDDAQPSLGPISLTAFALVAQRLLWFAYWIAQGIALAGLWTIGVSSMLQADHNNLSPMAWLNHSVGYVCHSMLFLPYLSWRITHLRHHQHTGSMEKDEVYIPALRSELKLPPAVKASHAQYAEALDESPIVTCIRFVVMQLFGMRRTHQWNTTGSKRFPTGANHWLPSSGLFPRKQRMDIIISNIGIVSMFALLTLWSYHSSITQVVKVYFIPFLFANHWYVIVTMTFLQHSCPTVPFYRDESWTKARGSLATIDRVSLPWLDIFLGLNHYHTTHHLSIRDSTNNLSIAHGAIRPLLGDMYNYDSTTIFWALKRSFTECLFVEDEGGVLFYKDKRGLAKRALKGE